MNFSNAAHNTLIFAVFCEFWRWYSRHEKELARAATPVKTARSMPTTFFSAVRSVRGLRPPEARRSCIFGGFTPSSSLGATASQVTLPTFSLFEGWHYLCAGCLLPLFGAAATGQRSFLESGQHLSEALIGVALARIVGLVM